MYSCGPPHMDVQEWDDQHELTYSSYVRTRDVTLKTCRRQWMIGRNGERRSGISAQAARHDDDDDDIYIYMVRSFGLTFESTGFRSQLREDTVYPHWWVLIERNRSVCGWLYIYIYIYSNPLLQSGCNSKSIFKRSLTGLNSEFSFS